MSGFKSVWEIGVKDNVSASLKKVVAAAQKSDGSLESLTDKFKESEVAIDDVAAAIREMRKDAKKFEKDGLDDEFKKATKAADDLEDVLVKMGGKKSLGSLYGKAKQLRKELTKTRDSAKFDEIAKDLAKVNAQIDEAKKKMRSGGGGGKKKGGLFSRIKAGMGDVKAEIGGMGGIGGSGLGIQGGMFNPATAVAAGAMALGQFTASAIQSGEEIRQLRGDVERLTGATGDLADKGTAKVAAIARTFDQDQQEVLKTANALAKVYGTDIATALDMVKTGFAAGADANGDFLSQIGEYSTQFKEAGYNAEEMVAVITQGTREGIFDDKAADAVKEFGLRIREQTPAVKDALNAAFGPEQTAEMLKGIQSGEISTADALKRVSEKVSTMGDGQKRQTLIADLFGGAGEDAGERFFGMMAGGVESMDELIKKGGMRSKQLMKEADLQEQLAAAQGDLGKAMGGAGDGVKMLKLQLQIILTRIITPIVEYFRIIYDSIKEAVGGGKELEDVFNVVGDVLSFLMRNLGKFFGFIIGKQIELLKELVRYIRQAAAVVGLAESEEDEKARLAGYKKGEEQTKAEVQAMQAKLKAGTATEADKAQIRQTFKALGRTPEQAEAFISSGGNFDAVKQAGGTAMGGGGMGGLGGGGGGSTMTGGIQTDTVRSKTTQIYFNAPLFDRTSINATTIREGATEVMDTMGRALTAELNDVSTAQ